MRAAKLAPLLSWGMRREPTVVSGKSTDGKESRRRHHSALYIVHHTSGCGAGHEARGMWAPSDRTFRRVFSLRGSPRTLAAGGRRHLSCAGGRAQCTLLNVARNTFATPDLVWEVSYKIVR
ncbi:hypothetical protein EVAR_42093_1 [Eumeta japonica]|uniref:Uncharacterized protein n=1 Tax=Eumeta variegata TaxID=151549 RepID=A0A4C1XJ72_EUMVA|nr:hypothetical protein EVAR_42093_1 [Eumeta japonica]